VLSYISASNHSKTSGSMTFLEIPREHSIYFPIEHEVVNRYGDESDDTASELNGSQCSGDTRADIYCECEQEVIKLMEIEFNDDDADDINDIVSDYQKEIYSDCVAFRKSTDQSSYITQRQQYW